MIKAILFILASFSSFLSQILIPLKVFIQ